MPKLGHPESKHTIDVSPAQVGLYESQGWQVKRAAVKKSAPASKKDEN